MRRYIVILNWICAYSRQIIYHFSTVWGKAFGGTVPCGMGLEVLQSLVRVRFCEPVALGWWSANEAPIA